MAARIDFYFNDDGTKQPQNPNTQSRSGSGQAPGTEDPRHTRPARDNTVSKESKKRVEKEVVESQKQTEKRTTKRTSIIAPKVDLSRTSDAPTPPGLPAPAGSTVPRLTDQRRSLIPFRGMIQRPPDNSAFAQTVRNLTNREAHSPLRLTDQRRSLIPRPGSREISPRLPTDLSVRRGELIPRGGGNPGEIARIQPYRTHLRYPTPPAPRLGGPGGRPPIPPGGGLAAAGGGAGRGAAMAGGGVALGGMGLAVAGIAAFAAGAATAAAALYGLERIAYSSGKSLRDNLGDVMPSVGLARGLAAGQRAQLGLQIDNRIGGRLGTLEMAEAGRERFAQRRDAALFEIFGPITETREILQYKASEAITGLLENLSNTINANGGILGPINYIGEVLTGIKTDGKAQERLLREMVGMQSNQMDEMITALNMGYASILPVPGTYEDKGGL